MQDVNPNVASALNAVPRNYALPDFQTGGDYVGSCRKVCAGLFAQPDPRWHNAIAWLQLLLFVARCRANQFALR